MDADRGAGPRTGEDLRALLRREVGRFRAGERRRRFPTSVQVGRLAGPRIGFVVAEPDRSAWDHALRTDVVCTLAVQAPPGLSTVWLARSGVPQLRDEDLAWLAAALAGFGILGRRPDGVFAITRTGWLDVRTGESRTWKRLRLRGASERA